MTFDGGLFVQIVIGGLAGLILAAALIALIGNG